MLYVSYYVSRPTWRISVCCINMFGHGVIRHTRATLTSTQCDDNRHFSGPYPTGTICTKPGHFCVPNTAFRTPGQTASKQDCAGKTGMVGHLAETLTLTLTLTLCQSTRQVCKSTVCILPPAFAEMLWKEGMQKEKYKKATKVTKVVKTTINVLSTAYFNKWAESSNQAGVVCCVHSINQIIQCQFVGRGYCYA